MAHRIAGVQRRRDECRGNSLVLQRASAAQVGEVAMQQGMRRLRVDGLDKVKQGGQISCGVGTGAS